MKNNDFEKLIKEFDESLPHFDDGRIDYSDVDRAPVLTCFVKVGEVILLLKRSDKVRAYKGKWNAIGGYLDEVRPLKEKIFEELQEELGVQKDSVVSYYEGEKHEFTDEEIGMTWITFPVLVELSPKPEIKLDWEHDDYAWVNPEKLKNYDIVSKLEENLTKVLGKK